MIEANLAVARRLGISVASDGSMPNLPSLSKIANVMPELPGRRRIIVNINPSDPSWHRMWPEQYWVGLCNQLLEDYRTDLVFIGTKENQTEVQELVHKLKDPTRVYNVAGRILLIELLKLIHDSELVISVDSGAMQMAAWVGTPVVALFGPETPGRFAPKGKDTQIVWAGLSCSPCTGFAAGSVTGCKDNQCMKQISPERVLSACKMALVAGKSPTKKSA